MARESKNEKPVAGIKNFKTDAQRQTKNEIASSISFCLSSFPLLFIHFMYNDIKLSNEEEGAQLLTTSPLKRVVRR